MIIIIFVPEARITFTRVYDASIATIVFKLEPSNTISYVEHYAYVPYYPYLKQVSFKPYPPTGSWSKCYVYLTSGVTKRTVMHELGHCFGLKHREQGSTSSIMFTSDSSNSGRANTVTLWDAGLINKKYK